MEDKETERQKKAKKALKEYEKSKKAWSKRLANLKIVCGIIVLGLCESTLTRIESFWSCCTVILSSAMILQIGRPKSRTRKRG